MDYVPYNQLCNRVFDRYYRYAINDKPLDFATIPCYDQGIIEDTTMPLHAADYPSAYGYVTCALAFAIIVICMALASMPGGWE